MQRQRWIIVFKRYLQSVLIFLGFLKGMRFEDMKAITFQFERFSIYLDRKQIEK